MAEVKNKNKDVNNSKEPTTKKNTTNAEKEKNVKKEKNADIKKQDNKNICNAQKTKEKSVEKASTKSEKSEDNTNKKTGTKANTTQKKLTTTKKTTSPQAKAKTTTPTKTNTKSTTKTSNKKVEEASKETPKQEKSKEKPKKEPEKEIVEKVVEEVSKEIETIQQEEKKTKEPILVSLKEIKETLGNKIKDGQKKNIIKEVFANIGTAAVIITYLFIIFMSCRSMEKNILAYDLKVFAMGFAVIGIIILEVAYKKDNTKIAFTGAEIIFFAMINLCLVYVIKLNFERILKIVIYISIGVAAYYIIKTLYVLIKNIRKYKKANNDIKEIIKK